MVAFCMTLISPLQTLYNDFNQYRKKMKIKAGGSPQVCMLQKIVKDSLDIDIVILEGDGKPIDFIIQTAFTDTDKERQLFSLLDRYKLAGKSYSYENKQVIYDVQWSGYVCETREATFEQKWSKYICEKGNGDNVNNITITYYWGYDPEWNATIMKRVRIKATKPVQSDLMISAELYVLGYHDSPLTADFPLKSGEDLIDMDTWVMDKHSNERIFPKADYYYNYELLIRDEYE